MTEFIETDENVQKILENVVEVGFEGKPIPNWEDSNSFEDLKAQYNIPGIGMVVIQDFIPHWFRFFGTRVNDPTKENLNVNRETLFEAASATKTIVTVLALNLVEKGVLELDTDVNNHLKSWKIPDNEFTINEKVTLRRLLTHTAGINRPDSMYSQEESSSPTLLNVLNGESPATNDAVKVEFVPGSNYQYSNLAFDIIQQLIEEASGKSINQNAEEIIYKPLEINSNNCTLEYPLPPHMTERAIEHHPPDGKPLGKGLHNSAYAHGNLSINPVDFAKFAIEIMLAYQGRSTKILSQDMTREMLKSYRSFGPTEMMGITDQALGFFLMKNDENTFFLLPGSNAPGANCMLLGSPLTGQGAVIMTNGAMGELLNMRLTYTLSKAYNWNFGT